MKTERNLPKTVQEVGTFPERIRKMEKEIEQGVTELLSELLDKCESAYHESDIDFQIFAI